jgi:hypothetical protein
MVTLFALLVAHRKVADWPRSIVLGSTVKLPITGLAGGGGGGGGGASVFGGGGGAGTFFLQPSATKNIETTNNAALI